MKETFEQVPWKLGITLVSRRLMLVLMMDTIQMLSWTLIAWANECMYLFGVLVRMHLYRCMCGWCSG